jgi:hypothetical protein
MRQRKYASVRQPVPATTPLYKSWPGPHLSSRVERQPTLGQLPDGDPTIVF